MVLTWNQHRFFSIDALLSPSHVACPTGISSSADQQIRVQLPLHGDSCPCRVHAAVKQSTEDRWHPVIPLLQHLVREDGQMARTSMHRRLPGWRKYGREVGEAARVTCSHACGQAAHQFDAILRLQ
jgi:hypothetical protein